MVVTCRITDFAHGGLRDALEKVREANRKRPVVLALTCLHEPHPQDQHPQPYPFDPLAVKPGEPPAVTGPCPRTCCGWSASRRRSSPGWSTGCVPIDLTRPEDGFADPNYGGEVLKRVLIDALPGAYRPTLRPADGGDDAPEGLHLRHAMPVILAYSSLAATAGAVPIPFVDLLLLPGIQAKMVHAPGEAVRPADDRDAVPGGGGLAGDGAAGPAGGAGGGEVHPVRRVGGRGGPGRGDVRSRWAGRSASTIRRSTRATSRTRRRCGSSTRSNSPPPSGRGLPSRSVESSRPDVSPVPTGGSGPIGVTRPHRCEVRPLAPGPSALRGEGELVAWDLAKPRPDLRDPYAAPLQAPYRGRHPAGPGAGGVPVRRRDVPPVGPRVVVHRVLADGPVLAGGVPARLVLDPTPQAGRAGVRPDPGVLDRPRPGRRGRSSRPTPPRSRPSPPTSSAT